MKRSQRLLSALLCVVLVLSLSLPAAAEGEPTLAVTTYDSVTYPGSYVTVYLYLRQPGGVGALDFDLHYDPDVLTQESYDVDGTVYSSVNTQTPGLLRCSILSMEGLQEDLQLMTVSFRVAEDAAPGESAITLSIGDAHRASDLAEMTLLAENGSIRIREPEVSPPQMYVYGSASPETLQQGDTTDLTFSAWNMSGFASGVFDLTYDDTRFAFDSITLGDALTTGKELFSVNSDNPGLVRLTYASETAAQDGTLFTLRLRAIADVTAQTEVRLAGTDLYTEDLAAMQNAETSVWLNLEQLPPPPEDLPDLRILAPERVVPNEPFDLILELEGTSAVAAGDFTLTYDPALFEITAEPAAAPELSGVGMVMVNPKYADGTVRFSFICEDGLTADQKVLVIPMRTVGSVGETGTFSAGGRGLVDAAYQTVLLECPDVQTEIAACAHAETETHGARDATCTEPGSTGDVVCKVCGETIRTSTVIPALGHDYKAVVTDPTCTEQGYTTHTCTRCGDSYVDCYVDALGHTIELRGAKDATCTEPGYTGDQFCTVCQQTIETGSEIPALGHDYEVTVTPPTCTEQGYTTHTCSRCGDSHVDTYTDALGHDYKDTVTAPTCTEQGYTTHTCSRCDDTYVDAYTDALGHDYKDTVTDPTCTEQGYTTHTCSRCDDTYVDAYTDALGHKTDRRGATEPTCTEPGHTWEIFCTVCGTIIEAGEEVPALGHDYEVTVTAPTCTEQGYTTHACKRCDHSFVDSHVDALGHDYKDIVTAPTCTEKGFTTHTCTRCGDSYVDSYVDALGHTIELRGAKDATCTEPGYTGDQYCSVCHELLETGSEIPALGHDYKSVVTAPTCTEKGYTTHTCSRCDDTYVDAYTDALGHDYKDTVTAPTCTEKGYTTHSCSRCGDSYVDSYTDALGHDYKGTVTAPTCTEKGYTTHTCSRCGDSHVDTYTNALGHDYKAVVTDPTCTEKGYTTHTCSRCGDSYVDTYTNALGHKLQTRGAKAATCTAAGYTGDQVCSVCGKTVTRGKTIPAKGHSWSAWKVTKPATETAEGAETRTCSACGKTESNVIPKRPKQTPNNPFVDVKEGKYFFDAVLWAVSRKITDGTSATTFSPNNPCTRGQIVTFLYRDQNP